MSAASTAGSRGAAQPTEEPQFLPSVGGFMGGSQRFAVLLRPPAAQEVTESSQHLSSARGEAAKVVAALAPVLAALSAASQQEHTPSIQQLAPLPPLANQLGCRREAALVGMDYKLLPQKNTFLDDFPCQERVERRRARSASPRVFVHRRETEAALTPFSIALVPPSSASIDVPGVSPSSPQDVAGGTEQISSDVLTPLEAKAEALGALGRGEPSYQGKNSRSVKLGNLPGNFSTNDFVKLLVDEGFEGDFDFAYAPCTIKTGKCRGYGVVRLVSYEAALRFRIALKDYGLDVEEAKAPVLWGGVQGEVAGVRCVLHERSHFIDRYRNSDIMQDTVPDCFKPVLFGGDSNLRFPPPTQELKQKKKNTRKKNAQKRRKQ